MLKVTYTETGLCLEYCPEPLDLLLSDRVCMYARARRPITVHPMRASIPLPMALAGVQDLQRFAEVDLCPCDRDWVEITLGGLWVTEDLEQEDGVFLTELNPRLEQRIFKLWTLAQGPFSAVAIAHGSHSC